jgi:hypothetical protein
VTTTSPAGTAPVADAAPSLSVGVDVVEVVRHAAVPTLRFRLRVTAAGGEPVQALALQAQVQIAATGREYDPASQQRLVELFGLPPQWGDSLRSLPWTRASVSVPAFTGQTTVDLSVPCTYDFDVTATKYLHSLPDGDIPLEVQFRGTIFYHSEGRLRAAQLPWDTEAGYRMPVSVWRDLMDAYFPECAWLRLGRETFDRLHAYKAENTLGGWDEAVDSLLAEAAQAASPAGTASEPGGQR